MCLEVVRKQLHGVCHEWGLNGEQNGACELRWEQKQAQREWKVVSTPNITTHHGPKRVLLLRSNGFVDLTLQLRLWRTNSFDAQAPESVHDLGRLVLHLGAQDVTHYCQTVEMEQRKWFCGRLFVRPLE